jgi:putative ABC transport system permease protein
MREDRWWRRYWRSLGFGKEVAEELEFHVDLITKDLIATGMAPADAAREAARRFGDRRALQTRLESVERKRGRHLRLTAWAGELLADLRYGVRGLFKRPGYSVAASLSLSLGIGAATVVLSIVDAWLFRPLAVGRPERLILLGATYPAIGSIVVPGLSLPMVSDLRQRKDLFDEVAAWQFTMGSIRHPNAERSTSAFIIGATGNYFDFLGVRAAIGRTFSQADASERSPVVVLSHQFWKSQFAGDSSLIGKSILIASSPFTVIGVTPPEFTSTEHLISIDAYVTTGVQGIIDVRTATAETDYGAVIYQAIARQRANRSLDQIRAALDVFSGQLAAASPSIPAGYRIRAYPERLARPIISAAGVTEVAGLAILGLAALVLTAAAVNVTNLILARASTRHEEIAVRLALGASRARVVRQLLTESALLGILGFLGATLVARLAVGAIARMPASTAIPLRLDFAIDGRILGMTLAVAVIAGLISGLGPALIASRSVQGTLRRAGRGGLGGQGGRLRSGLVVAQVAASFLVLVAAGLFAMSVRRASQVQLGMDPRGVSIASIDASQIRLDGRSSSKVFERMALLLREVPGIDSVAVSSAMPLNAGGSGDFLEVQLPDSSVSTDGKGSVTAMSYGVDPSFFGVMGIPIRAGRGLTIDDDSAAARVAVVNEHAAKIWWPGQDPIGRRFRIASRGTTQGPSPWIEVVGVIPTGPYLLITEAPRPFIAMPMAQYPFNLGVVSARTSLDRAGFENAVRTAAASISPDLAPFGIEAVERLVRNGVNGLLPLRFGSWLTTAIGALALVLTVVGLYGVLAYSVQRETREIGVRMALGAEPAAIVGRVLRRGGRLVGGGIVIGAGLALAGAPVVRNLLGGVPAAEVWIYGMVALVLIAIAAGAAFLPARRAARLDPVRALRAD